MSASERWTTWLAALAISAASARLVAQTGQPTPVQAETFSNVDKLESRITLDQQEYLPRETARITVVLRNPTGVALRVPEPFHQQTGACYMLRRGTVGRDLYGDEQVASAATYRVRWDVPTIILAPGQEVTRTVSTKDGGVAAWGGQVRIPDQPGDWRMKYGYDQRMGVNFKIARATKLWAISIIHFPPTEEMDYGAGKPTVKSAVVPFLVVETLPGEYWLFRGDPRRKELSPWPFKEYSLDVLYSQIPFFERVRRLDEAATALRTELRGDDTVDVEAQTAGGRTVRFNVPARPARANPPTQ